MNEVEETTGSPPLNIIATKINELKREMLERAQVRIAEENFFKFLEVEYEKDMKILQIIDRLIHIIERILEQQK
jgi:hypothetical protein